MSRIRFQLEASSPGTCARVGRLNTRLNTRHHASGREVLTPVFSGLEVLGIRFGSHGRLLGRRHEGRRLHERGALACPAVARSLRGPVGRVSPVRRREQGGLLVRLAVGGGTTGRSSHRGLHPSGADSALRNPFRFHTAESLRDEPRLSEVCGTSQEPRPTAPPLTANLHSAVRNERASGTRFHSIKTRFGLVKWTLDSIKTRLHVIKTSSDRIKTVSRLIDPRFDLIKSSFDRIKLGSRLVK